MSIRKVRIVTDSTCDLTKELAERFNIVITPLCIILDDVSYFDGVDLTPDQIYEWADKNGKTPKTAAISYEKFTEQIKPFMDADEDVIYIGISEDMSTTCNVARLVGQDFSKGRLFVVDSKNLSTGVGLQVIRAAELAAQGLDAETIVKKIEEARDKVRASFVVDTMTYLARGGRCNGAVAFAANTLKIHPSIRVVDGKMIQGKKYRGNMDKVLLSYVKDEEELQKADKTRVFITHSGSEPEIVQSIYDYVKSLGYFDEILTTRAGGVISSHCGYGTLGVLYYLKED